MDKNDNNIKARDDVTEMWKTVDNLLEQGILYSLTVHAFTLGYSMAMSKQQVDETKY